MALAARLNLTITAARLAELARTTGPPGRASWAFTRDTDHGPPGGHGSWTLTLPGGGNLSVELQPVPTFGCDHRFESHDYQPNDTLRHLVQVRDGNCTFPPCSRHARESDFEHATPYGKGGRTCGCNAGAGSRACHQVKQSPGWNVTQPRPGWHQWVTPSGRAYIQGPKRYPAQPLLFGEVLSAAGAPVGHPDEGFQVGEDERAVFVAQAKDRPCPGAVAAKLELV